jgi:hypothetical protein
MPTTQNSIPLFLAADPVGEASAGLGLTLYPTPGSGHVAGIPLYTASDASGNRQERSVPLSVLGADRDASARGIPLWVGGEYHAASAGLPLVAWGPSGVYSGLTLYVAGAGTAAGATPLERSLPLFIRRNPADALPLYLAGPGDPAGSGLPLYARGAHGAASGLTLALPASVGAASEGLKLYARGW